MKLAKDEKIVTRCLKILKRVSSMAKTKKVTPEEHIRRMLE